MSVTLKNGPRETGFANTEWERLMDLVETYNDKRVVDESQDQYPYYPNENWMISFSDGEAEELADILEEILPTLPDEWYKVRLFEITSYETREELTSDKLIEIVNDYLPRYKQHLADKDKANFPSDAEGLNIILSEDYKVGDPQPDVVVILFEKSGRDMWSGSENKQEIMEFIEFCREGGFFVQ